MCLLLYLLGKNSQGKLKVYNLYEEVQKLLIAGKNDRTHVSHDIGVFELLISSFYNYEVSSFASCNIWNMYV